MDSSLLSTLTQHSDQLTAATLIAEEHIDTSSFYIFGDEKHDRDRLIAQSRVFGDYVQRSANRIVQERPKRILDIGCGDGQLTTVFGKVYRTAQIVGVDHDPVAIEAAQKRLPRVPGLTMSNIQFVTGDVQEALPTGPFDLIYASLVFLHLGATEQTLRNCFNALAPGGTLWIKESGDFDVEGRPAFGRWVEMTMSAMTKMGRKLLIAKDLEDMLSRVGFTSVRQVNEHYDLNDNTLAGRVMLSVALASCYNTIPMLNKIEKIPTEELLALHAKVREELEAKPVTANLPNILAQRPLPEA